MLIKNVLTLASCTCVAIPCLADFHSRDGESYSVNFLFDGLLGGDTDTRDLLWKRHYSPHPRAEGRDIQGPRTGRWESWSSEPGRPI